MFQNKYQWYSAATFLLQTIFPEGTNQVEKSRKYQGMGGGGGGGMKSPLWNGNSLGGMDFYWNYTIYVKCEEHRLRKS